LDRLFTPWRLSYVTQSGLPTSACIFCDALTRIDDQPLVVHRGQRAYVILNKYPYNNGHVMVVPHRHAGRLSDFGAEELAEMMTLAQAVERALGGLYHPHGFNMGVNVGTAAGAGVLDHLHLHIVPRWLGDTNFMSVFGDTRVLPEDLTTTAARVREALRAVVESGAADLQVGRRPPV
jgi:ATP adenylyltransferase